MLQKRTAFYVSDRTGITAEMLGHSLLTQFEGVAFTEIPVPFVDSLEKAQDLLRRISDAGQVDGRRALVFTTLVDPEISSIVASADALVLDCFEIFIAPLEAELGIKSSHTVGRSHSAADVVDYHRRIEAVNYALAHDDGVSTRDLAEADVILVGVSRSGKTPTCLYLALQFGVRAANYPLVPEDFSSMRLPSQLRSFRAHHQCRSPAAYPQRAQAGKLLCHAAQLPIRGAGGGGADAAGRHSLLGYHHQVHRGDRHPRAARGEAGEAHLLKSRVESGEQSVGRAVPAIQ